jgi:cytochrome c-type biogenesis protein CcmH
MMTGFIVLAALIAVLVVLWVVLPLVTKRSDATASAPYAALGIAAATFVLGGGVYAALSNFDWSEPETSAADSPQRMVANLARKLERNPEDLNGWLMLGRSYTVLEQFPLAARAYQRADRLASGRNAEALTGLAESLALQDETELDGRAGRLFEQALEIDPTSGKALFFTGAAAMRRGDLPVARERFSRLLDLQPPENIRPILQQQIAAIDAQLTSGTTAVDASKSATGATDAPPSDGAASKPAPAAVTGEARVAVKVSLGAKLAAKDLAGTPLFVFVREPGVPGPPIAVKRLAATFPAEVVLTPADSMLAGREITAGQKVEVVARLSRGGTPTASSGDPFGAVGYDVGKDGVVDLVIDQVTP